MIAVYEILEWEVKKISYLFFLGAVGAGKPSSRPPIIMGEENE